MHEGLREGKSAALGEDKWLLNVEQLEDDPEHSIEPCVVQSVDALVHIGSRLHSDTQPPPSPVFAKSSSALPR